MTASNDVNEKQGIIAKLKSVKHIEIIVAVALCAVFLLGYFVYTQVRDKTEVSEATGASETAEKVADIVSAIEGVGKCEILITYDGAESVQIAYDEETVTTVTTDSDDNSDR